MSAAGRELVDALRWMVAFEEATVDAARVRATARQLERIDEMLASVGPSVAGPEARLGPGAARSHARSVQRRFGPIAIDCLRETVQAVAGEQRRLVPLAAAVDLLVGEAGPSGLRARLEERTRTHTVLAGAPEGEDAHRLHREIGGWEVCLGSLEAAEETLASDASSMARSAREDRVTRRVRLAFNDVLEPFDEYFHDLTGEEPS